MTDSNRNANELQFAAYNPRTINEHDFGALGTSMTKFGDLSAIVNNRRTDTLVGGHQRLRNLLQQFKDQVVIEIRDRYDQPDEFGTTALGYISVAGTTLRFPYREVDWPIEIEKAANIAANRIQGEFDIDMVANLTAELNALDPNLAKLTGQTDREIKKMLQISSAPETPPAEDPSPEDDKTDLSFRVSRDQGAIIHEAITYIKEHKNLEGMDHRDLNGLALYFVAREFLDYTNGLDG